MKKLMIAFAAIACATGLQAAVVNWDMTVDTKGGNPVGSYASFLVDGTKWAGKSVSDAAMAIFGGSTVGVMSVGESELDGPGVVYTGAYRDDLPTGYNNGDFVTTLWEIVFNGTVGDGATADSYFAYESVDPQRKISSAGLLTGPSKEFDGGTEWQSVPEPTSGLLLLIGVAGLALRRRRA